MRLKYSVIIGLVCSFVFGQNNYFAPGKHWKDTDGVHINAHGGGILFADGLIIGMANLKLQDVEEIHLCKESAVTHQKICIIGKTKALF